MQINFDREKKTATVWLSHDDEKNEEKQEKLKAFLAECKSNKIFACVFRSGEENLLDNTKALLAYNCNLI